MRAFITALFSILIVTLANTSIPAQTTEFTYQGNLQNASQPATGNFDFEFALFDSPTAGVQLGSVLTRNTVAVTGGTFSVILDFGSQFPGSGRYLEISVRTAGGGAYTLLSPRQYVTSAPYAVMSRTSDNALKLGGAAASEYVLTNDGRLSDARPPLAGSSSYIQNGTGQQAGSNFNISGNGTAGGTLSGQTVNASFEYRLLGQPFLSAVGNNSRFGLETGSPNLGVNNTFSGYRSGAATTSNSSHNAFFGSDAGRSNSEGNNNAFFGRAAGDGNIAGSGNVFVGASAGVSNTSGSNNTMIGNGVNVTQGDLSFATALGAGSVVSSNNTVVLGRPGDTVQVPGALAVTGGITGTISNATNAAQLGGVAAAQYVQTGDTRLSDARAPLPGSENYIQNGTTAQAGSNFNVTGTGMANIFNATLQYNLGGSRVLFAGSNNNTFLGLNSGTSNSGVFNSFFGSRSGWFSTGGSSNSYFGYSSGVNSSAGDRNSFFGAFAGMTSTLGVDNAFVGYGAGSNNGTGSQNTFVGANAGTNSVNLSSNTLIGSNANIGGFGTASNATAIGANSVVTQNYSLVLGSISGLNGATADTSVGIGTTAPAAKLHVNNGSIRVTNGAVYITNPNTLIITSPNGACWGLTVSNAGAVSAFPVNPCP